MKNVFFKGHGLGNDYIALNPKDLDFKLTPKAIRAICDRRSQADLLIAFVCHAQWNYRLPARFGKEDRIEPAAVRKVDIEKDHVPIPRLRGMERIRQALHAFRPVPQADHELRQDIANRPVVVHDENIRH